jgi:hypothetical protein
MKYLIRDPIFDKFTRQIIVKIFSVLRLPTKMLDIIFSIISYFRYYAYIAWNIFNINKCLKFIN